MACSSIHPNIWAQDYPRKTIKLIIPATTGSSDVIARALAPRLGAALGQSVVVEQMPGAGTNIGNNHVAKAAPDGHTLLINGLPLSPTWPSTANCPTTP